MTWLPDTAAGATPFARAFGLRPELFAQYQMFAELFWTRRPVDPVVLELCRLRIAQLLGSATELAARRPEARAAGLTEARIAALDHWRDTPDFSAVERACLAFAEKFTLDPHGVSDADAAAVTAHLSAPEMVAFTEALAVFDGFTRFRLILGIEADRPR